ncbi:unnamed protein product, partial [Allacma fusca]
MAARRSRKRSEGSATGGPMPSQETDLNSLITKLSTMSATTASQ